MPCEHVNEAAFAVGTEGHLGPRIPADLDELGNDRFDELGVIGSCEPGKVSPSRPWSDIHADVEDSTDRSQRPQAQGVEVPVLDSRDGCVGDVREDGDVDLSKAPPQAHRPNYGTNTLVIHARIVQRGTYPALARALA